MGCCALLPPGDLPDPGIKPASLTSALAGRFFTAGTAWEAPQLPEAPTFLGSQPLPPSLKRVRFKDTLSFPDSEPPPPSFEDPCDDTAHSRSSLMSTLLTQFHQQIPFWKNLCAYFWLCWVFVAVLGLSLVVASGGPSLLWCAGFSSEVWWLLLLQSRGSRYELA